MKKIFVTGTDTDVGKTVVTKAIVRALVNSNQNVTAIKPVESGVPIVNGMYAPHDGLGLKTASKSTLPVNKICRYMFKDAISPHLAAKNETKTIDEQEVLTFLKSHEENTDIVIAEGAGGLLVPLNDNTLYANFIAHTGYELLIISPNILGTINTTLLTIEAARARHIPIMGVILNGENDTFGNADAIKTHGDVPILGIFPTVDNFDLDSMASIASQTIDLNVFRK